MGSHQGCGLGIWKFVLCSDEVDMLKMGFLDVEFYIVNTFDFELNEYICGMTREEFRVFGKSSIKRVVFSYKCVSIFFLIQWSFI